MILWFDMDGVLDNFNDYADKLSPNRGKNKDYSELTEEEKRVRAVFWDDTVKKDPYFWKKLEEIPNINKLINYSIRKFGVENLNILSSIPKHVSEDYKNIIKQCKLDWLDEHFPYIFENIVLCEGKKEEYMIGKPKENILIDDRPYNIQKWIEKGGIGILFKSSEQALEELKKVI